MVKDIWKESIKFEDKWYNDQPLDPSLDDSDTYYRPQVSADVKDYVPYGRTLRAS